MATQSAVTHPMNEIPNKPNPLRLRKRHGTGERPDVGPADGERLVGQQSIRGALVAALLATMLFCIAWVAICSLTYRIFPWMTIVLGTMVGFAVRRAGKGVDWRFPTLAAVFALAGSLLGNIVVAASVTADELGTGTLEVLRNVTSMTWPVFFDEVMNAADGFYAVCSAAIAAFLANRRLSRKEYYAIRLVGRASDGHQ